ncbi:stAR-related lipid transfer protein 5 [Scleropages formosus]|uniref:StAR related lipid transfer domain containing 5 n=1 Tax=Scleropages formosus TaxID=113540 RepID=A0A8C9VW38_SCLFO|nr:stAR-related lipid transfer protein 5-like [Scleropages formosus]
MDYERTAHAVADRLLGYTKDGSGWKPCKKTNDVVVYWRPSTEFPGNLYKGDGLVRGAVRAVWECLKPAPGGLRLQWDRNVDQFELIQKVSEDISVYRTVTPSAAMGIISPRDFVDVVLVKQYEDGTISSNATHVTHPGCPPQLGYVRGFNHPCGCFCVPVSGDPDKTQVLSFFQTDLGGFLPRSVVDSFFPASMAEFYSNLNKAVKSLKEH